MVAGTPCRFTRWLITALGIDILDNQDSKAGQDGGAAEPMGVPVDSAGADDRRHRIAGQPVGDFLTPVEVNLYIAACLLATAAWACGGSGGQRVDPTRDSRRSIVPKGAPSGFFAPRPIGDPIRGNERPQIRTSRSPISIGDGLPDVLVCDALRNRIAWIRQFPEGVFTERRRPRSRRRRTSRRSTFDGDGDLDLVVAASAC